MYFYICHFDCFNILNDECNCLNKHIFDHSLAYLEEKGFMEMYGFCCCVLWKMGFFGIYLDNSFTKLIILVYNFSNCQILV